MEEERVVENVDNREEVKQWTKDNAKLGNCVHVEGKSIVDNVVDEFRRASGFHELCFKKLRELKSTGDKRASYHDAMYKEPLSSVDDIEKALKDSWSQALTAVADHFSDLFMALSKNSTNTTESKDVVEYGKTAEKSQAVAIEKKMEVLSCGTFTDRMPLIESAFRNDYSKWETLQFVKGFLTYIAEFGLQAFTRISSVIGGDKDENFLCEILIRKKEYGMIFEEVAFGSGKDIQTAELVAANKIQDQYLWNTPDKAGRIMPVESVIKMLKDRITNPPIGTQPDLHFLGAKCFIIKESIEDILLMIESGVWIPFDWNGLAHCCKERPVYAFFGSPSALCFHGVAEVSLLENADCSSTFLLKWICVKDVIFDFLSERAEDFGVIFRSNSRKIKEISLEHGIHLMHKIFDYPCEGSILDAYDSISRKLFLRKQRTRMRNISPAFLSN